ncbi:MAG: thioredoxin family protein [Anaerolineales bacterium]|nr:thioredoxin family protein [Anaerolineales bacterium]
MEKLLDNEITGQIQQVFENLRQPVEVLFFGKKTGCEYCDDTLQLIEEVTGLSDKLGLSAYDIEDDQALAQQYKVDKAPGLVLVGRDGEQLLDYGVRYAGIPAGHEFSSLIQALLLVSGRDSGLSEATRQFLEGLEQPVLLQVFVTPNCPYCPRAVVLAHQMALESPMVEAEMVEAMEFPDLAQRFNVSGVPQTTINSGAGTVVGAVPEDYLVDEIQQAITVS